MITTVITKPSRLFLITSNSIWIVFGIMISHVFFDFLLFIDKQIHFEVMIIVIMTILAFVFKRHIVIGKIQWDEDKFRITMYDGTINEYSVGSINFLSVNILSYVGANVGLTFLPSDGCDNELYLHGNERKNRIRFKIEDRGQAMGLLSKLSGWKKINNNIAYDKTII